MSEQAPWGPDVLDPAIAAIDAWRARGDDRFDPVRFRLIEAMTRRASTHQGEARRILGDKVLSLVAAYGQDLNRRPRAEAVVVAPKPKGVMKRGPLSQLVEQMARNAASLHVDEAASATAVPALASAPEHWALGFFRSTWAKLSANKRLTQSIAKVPGNAGPLNSHHLVHRSLMLMRGVSPEYLNRFMGYVDALQWLEQANSGNGVTGSDSPRAEGKKSGRGKSA